MTSRRRSSTWNRTRKLTPSKIGAIVIRDGMTCAYCRVELFGTDFEIDHVRPLRHGGTSHAWNLVLACDDCNRAKGNGPVPSHARNEVRKRVRRPIDIKAGRAMGDTLYPWAPKRRAQQAAYHAARRAAGKGYSFP